MDATAPKESTLPVGTSKVTFWCWEEVSGERLSVMTTEETPNSPPGRSYWVERKALVPPSKVGACPPMAAAKLKVTLCLRPTEMLATSPIPEFLMSSVLYWPAKKCRLLPLQPAWE